ncbi:Conserved_hypothetical protein [Hexamita inflata]|uniref:Uncharacterized protein n=1 Tax=Hexamita inflata TaxID=28002 RepID=A0AA86QNF3_9EUKA|nr:Conserved hypothetical protein [Hexamita inflata]
MNCSVSSCEYEVFGTATGSNLGYYYEDGSDKVCTKCDQTAPEATRYYLRELVCSATRCPFFTNYSSFTNTTGTMNCSVSSCEYEVFGTATGSNLGYYYEDGSDKVCTKCDQTAPEATRYYLRELVCSATRCPFFTNYSSFTNTTGTMNCSVSSCEYEVFGTATGSNLGYYYEDGSDKVCTKCDQTAPEATRYYLRELVCSATRCPFFTNYSSFTNTTGTMNCSVSSCEYEVFGTATGSNLGYYYEDGSDKVCTKCDQTAPEATRYYLRELVCSATRCPFFTNYSSFTNTTGTMNCSVSSCEYEVFGTATGSNFGYYYEDGSDKVCTKCDQTAPEATRYYLRELVCSATRCPFFTNYSSFTNTTGTMNCSVSSCEYEVFGTATGSNLGYYYEDGSDKVCTKCDQTAPEATRYYLRELVCSATRCPFFTNYSSFTNTTGTMNCSVSSCEYEVFGTATGSNLGYYYEDGSDKVCTKCDQTAPEATRYYLRELVCSATRCPFFTNYSSFTNTTGTMNCSVSSCEYEVFGTATGSNLGYYYEDGSDKVCTKCDQTAPEATRYYLRELVCSATRCPFFTNYSSFTNTTGTMNCSVSSCEYEVFGTATGSNLGYYYEDGSDKVCTKCDQTAPEATRYYLRELVCSATRCPFFTNYSSFTNTTGTMNCSVSSCEYEVFGTATGSNLGYYYEDGSDKVCTKCDQTAPEATRYYLRELVCSATRCPFFTNYSSFTNTTGTMNCSVSSCEYEVFGTATGSNLGYYYEDGSDKVCTKCDQTAPEATRYYLRELVCSATRCPFFTNYSSFTNTTGTMNCSVSSCEYEVFGTATGSNLGYYYEDGSDKVCTKCDQTAPEATRYYLRELVCSATRCPFFTNYSSFTNTTGTMNCSVSSCEYEVFGTATGSNLGYYYEDGSDKVCTKCDQTAPEATRYYLRELVCSATRCPFFTNYSSFTNTTGTMNCSVSSCEYEVFGTATGSNLGYYYEDGSDKVCTKCDQTAPEATRYYLRELVCSATRCPFFTNYSSFTNTTGTMNCSVSSCEYEVFGTATGSNLGYYYEDGSDKVCTKCDQTAPEATRYYLRELVCSATRCPFFTNYSSFTNTTGTMNCSVSSCEYEVFGTATGSNLGYYYEDGSDKVCTKCDQTAPEATRYYLRELVCSATRCPFFTNYSSFTNTTDMNCSVSSCEYEVFGTATGSNLGYYYEDGSDKVCTKCDQTAPEATRYYLRELVCSATRCPFFTNYSSFTNTTGTMNCSVSSCEYEVFGTATGSNFGYYYEDGSDKVCTKCDQTAPEATRYYLRELVCSATRCPFFTNYSSFTNTTGTMNCSVSSCEYEVFGTATGSNLGYYYEDGSDKVCTKCDQTAPEATRYYLRELVCSATRCPFFTNYSSFTNTTGTMNCSVSSCEYEVFGTATGSNLGYYYEDGSDKVCTKCDQTAPEATRYYLRELVCSATRCPFFTNYSSFTNTTGTMNCSVSSCEYEVFGTATGSNLGYYYEDGSDKVCTKCDQTAPEATRYYLRELVCSATRCPFFTNYSSFTNTTGTMNCSVSSCEYEVFGTATGSNLGYYYEDGSDKVCTKCDQTAPEATRYYLRELVCSATRCPFFTNYSSFTNTTGTMNCSVSSCEYEVFGTATGSNLGYYYEDGSDKVCTKCDQTAPEATRYYLRELVCSATRCPFFTNYSSFTNTTGTMNCSVSSCEYEVFGTATGSNLGYYYEDGSDKVCTKCDQTAPEATRYYLRELVCSATRCPFFTNYSSFTNTTGTMNCSVSSCEYEVFGTATGSNPGYYYEDGSDKVCTKCDQTAPEATRYYLRELVCSATRCPFFTNYSSFTNTTGTMNCSVSSCEYEVFGTAIGSNLGYYYEDGSDKVCTKCDQTAPEATRYYLRELVCSATRCPFFTNYSSFTNTTGTMNCSVSSCEYEVFGTATGSNLGYYYEDGSDKVCTKCDQTAPEATRYYLRELVCSATRCPFFTNYSSFTNTTGTMNCSVSSCEYEVFGTAIGSNLGYYYEDGSDKVCTKCDKSLPEISKFYLRNLLCNDVECYQFKQFYDNTDPQNIKLNLCSITSCKDETQMETGYYQMDLLHANKFICTDCPMPNRWFSKNNDKLCIQNCITETNGIYFTNYIDTTKRICTTCPNNYYLVLDTPSSGLHNCSINNCYGEGETNGIYKIDNGKFVCTNCTGANEYITGFVCDNVPCLFYKYRQGIDSQQRNRCSLNQCYDESNNNYKLINNDKICWECIGNDEYQNYGQQFVCSVGVKCQYFAKIDLISGPNICSLDNCLSETSEIFKIVNTLKICTQCQEANYYLHQFSCELEDGIGTNETCDYFKDKTSNICSENYCEAETFGTNIGQPGYYINFIDNFGQLRRVCTKCDTPQLFLYGLVCKDIICQYFIQYYNSFPVINNCSQSACQGSGETNGNYIINGTNKQCDLCTGAQFFSDSSKLLCVLDCSNYGSFYYYETEGNLLSQKICTNCPNKYLIDDIVSPEVCSLSDCIGTSAGVFKMHQNKIYKICYQCIQNYFFDNDTFINCSVNNCNGIGETNGVYFTTLNNQRICTLCSDNYFLDKVGLHCTTACVNYYVFGTKNICIISSPGQLCDQFGKFFKNQAKNICSVTSCQQETLGLYFYEIEGDPSSDKICIQQCNNDYYINVIAQLCSSDQCATISNNKYMIVNGKKQCNQCIQQDGYLYGVQCKNQPCEYYVYYGQNICSEDQCTQIMGPFSGFWIQNGFKVCQQQCNIWENMTNRVCSFDNCSSTKQIFIQIDLTNRQCSLCVSTNQYLNKATNECILTSACQYYALKYPNICSQDSCLTESSEIYLIDDQLDKVCTKCGNLYFEDASKTICSFDNCATSSQGKYIQGNGFKYCSLCDSIGLYVVGFECTTVQCNIFVEGTTDISQGICTDACQNYYYYIQGNAINPMNGVKVCTQCLSNTFYDYNRRICSRNENCIETQGVYKIENGKRLCTFCTIEEGYIYDLLCKNTPCQFYQSTNICDLDQCDITNNIQYIGYITNNGNNICINTCANNKYESVSNRQCSLDECHQTSNSIIIQISVNHFECSKCDLSNQYLRGNLCSNIPCEYYITTEPNSCSQDQCETETNGVYYTNSQNKKICTLCSNNYYLDYNNKICSNDNCQSVSQGFYELIGNYMQCNICSSILLFKYGYLCSTIHCEYFITQWIDQIQDNVCHQNSCIDNVNKFGYYFIENGNNICNLCIGKYFVESQQLLQCVLDNCLSSSGKYKIINGKQICTNCTEQGYYLQADKLICSEIPCQYYVNELLNECANSCGNPSIYYIYNSFKICTSCSDNYFEDDQFSICSIDNCLKSSQRIYVLHIDSVRKYCYKCNQANDYLYNLECNNTVCEYFQLEFSNKCSIDICSSETFTKQYYYQKSGFKYCTLCINNYFESTVECSIDNCMQTSQNQYIANLNKRYCDQCNQPGHYLYGKECTNLPCQYYVQSNICSETQCSKETGGKYLNNSNTLTCDQCADNYYINMNMCSNDKCGSLITPFGIHYIINGKYICTSCLSTTEYLTDTICSTVKCEYFISKIGFESQTQNICSSNQCNGIYQVVDDSKICSGTCPQNYYETATLSTLICSRDLCQQTSNGIYENIILVAGVGQAGTYKQCTICQSVGYYLRESICSTQVCIYYIGLNVCDDTCQSTQGIHYSNNSCTICPDRYFVNVGNLECSLDKCVSTNRIYIYIAGNRQCSLCNSEFLYLRDFECSSTPCEYFVTTFQLGVSINQCSNNLCETESNGYYIKASFNSLTDQKICDQCINMFFKNTKSKECSADDCMSQTQGSYVVINSTKICDYCTTSGYYLQTNNINNNNLCSTVPCTFYTNLAARTCTTICPGSTYYVDNNQNKICNTCNGFSYFEDITMQVCSIDNCQQITSGKYSMIDSTNKLCVKCDSQNEYLNQNLECVVIPCIYYIQKNPNICTSSCETGIFYEISHLCTSCLNGYFKDSTTCSDDDCQAFSNGIFILISGQKICTKCDSITENLRLKECSYDMCEYYQTTYVSGISINNCSINQCHGNGEFYTTNLTTNLTKLKVCNQCVDNYFVSGNECSSNKCGSLIAPYGIFQQVGMKKICTQCSGSDVILQSDGVTCSTQKCLYYATKISNGDAINKCSNDQCVTEQLGKFKVQNGENICDQCSNNFYFDALKLNCSVNNCKSFNGVYKLIGAGPEMQCYSCSGLIDFLYGSECIQNSPCSYFIKTNPNICSTDQCSSTQKYVEHSGDKICDVCPFNYYVSYADSGDKECSVNMCSQTNGIYYVYDDTINNIEVRICTLCDSGSDYLYGLECKTTPCQFYISTYSAGIAINNCSQTQCRAETLNKGYYLPTLVCTNCSNNYFTNSLECDPTNCTSSYYIIQTGRRFCTLCDQATEYVRGSVCSNIQCEFYINHYTTGGQINRCSEDACSITNGQWKYSNNLRICSYCQIFNTLYYYENYLVKHCSTDNCQQTSKNIFVQTGVPNNVQCYICSGLNEYLHGEECLLGVIHKCNYFLQKLPNICSVDCQELSSQLYKYQIDSAGDKICNVCLNNYFEIYNNLGEKLCSKDSCSSTSQSRYVQMLDGLNNYKLCDLCESDIKFLTELQCGNIECLYFSKVFSQDGINKCSTTNCVFETQNRGYYILIQESFNSIVKTINKCTNCTNNYFMSGQPVLQCVSNCISTNNIYKVDSWSRNVCSLCQESTDYLYGLLCSLVQCEYYQSKYDGQGIFSVCSQSYCISETSGIYEIIQGNKLCTNCPNNYYDDLPERKQCSFDNCASRSNGIYYLESTKKICTTCQSLFLDPYSKLCSQNACLYYLSINPNICSIQCDETSRIFRIDNLNNKICQSTCSNGYYEDNTLMFCSYDNCSSSTNGTYYMAGQNKICTHCSLPNQFLYEKLCSTVQCTYYVKLFDVDSQNICSVTQCVFETTFGYYYINSQSLKICTLCLNNYFLNAVQLIQCSVDDCSISSNIYKMFENKKVCSTCSSTTEYLYDTLCQDLQCDYYQTKIGHNGATINQCSMSLCVLPLTNPIGYYKIIDNYKICDQCTDMYFENITSFRQCSNDKCQQTSLGKYRIQNNQYICTQCNGLNEYLVYLDPLDSDKLCQDIPCSFYQSIKPNICRSSCVNIPNGNTIGAIVINQFGQILCHDCQNKYFEIYDINQQIICSLDNCISTSLGRYNNLNSNNQMKVCNICENSNLYLYSGNLCSTTPCTFFLTVYTAGVQNINQCVDSCDNYPWGNLGYYKIVNSLQICDLCINKYFENVTGNKQCSLDNCSQSTNGIYEYNANYPQNRICSSCTNGNYLHSNSECNSTSCWDSELINKVYDTIGLVKQCSQTCSSQYSYIQNDGLCVDSCISGFIKISSLKMCTNCSDITYYIYPNGECNQTVCNFFKNVSDRICSQNCSEAPYNGVYTQISDKFVCDPTQCAGAQLYLYANGECSQRQCEFYQNQNQKECSMSLCLDETGGSYIIYSNGNKVCSVCSSSNYSHSNGECNTTACYDVEKLFRVYESGIQICKRTCDDITNFITSSGLCTSNCGSPLNTYIIQDIYRICDLCSNKLIQPNLECGKKLYCPDNTYLEAGKCVQVCSDVVPFAQDNICVSQCDSLAFYNQSGLQKLFCSKNMCNGYKLLNGTQYQCVDQCNYPYLYLEDFECKLSCQFYIQGIQNVIDPATLQIYGINICLDTCALYKSITSSAKQCITVCNNYLLKIQQNQYECVQSCAQTNNIYLDGQYCVSTCKNAYNDIQLTCDNSCWYYIYNQRKICTTTSQQCPNNMPFKFISDNNEIQCLSSCSTNYVDSQDNNLCLASCSGSFYMPSIIHNNQVKICYHLCPDNTYIDQTSQTNALFMCVSQCPRNSFIQEYTCVHSCTSQTYIQIDQLQICVDKCSNFYSYVGINRKCEQTCDYVQGFECIQSQSCNIYYTYLGVKYCQDQCSIIFNNETIGNYCLQTCPSFVFNHSCISQCPKYISNNQCVDVCPDDEAISLNTMQCKKCWYYLIINNIKYCSSVQNNCPENFPFKIKNGDYYQCVQSCGTFNLVDQYDNLLCKNCNTSIGYVIKQVYSFVIYICYDQCPKYIDKNQQFLGMNKCVNSCVKFINNMQCIDICQEKTFQQVNGENLCVDKCQSYYYKHQNGEIQCVEQCTSKATKHLQCVDDCEYEHDGICTDTCSLYEQSESTKLCVATCSIDKPFLLLNTCVSKCSNGYNYISEDKQRCVFSCSVYNDDMLSCNATCNYTTVHNQKICITSCPPNKQFKLRVNMRYECLEQCIQPFNSIININDPICTICQIGMQLNKNILNNKFINVCSMQCETGLYQYYDSEQNLTYCVQSCPQVKQFVQNRTCSSQCLNNIYLFVSGYYQNLFCQSECSQKMFFNKSNNHYECIQQCIMPYIYQYDNLCSSDACQYFTEQTNGIIICQKYDDCYNYETIKANKSRCISQCNLSTYINQFDKQCIINCASIGKYEQNGICVSSCNGDYAISHDKLKCSNQCWYYQIGLQKYCTEVDYQCPYTYMFKNYINQNRVMCQQQCILPKSHILSLDNMTCIQCHQFYIVQIIKDNIQVNICIDRCPDQYPLKVNTQISSVLCVQTCPLNKIYLETNNYCVSSCSSKSYFINQQNNYICLINQCQQYHIYNVPDNMNQCVDKCITPYNYIQNRNCTTNCLKYTVLTTGLFQCENCVLQDLQMCKIDCVQQNKLFYNGKCITDCPLSTYVSSDNLTCVVQCQPFETISSDQRRCVKFCKYSFEQSAGQNICQQANLCSTNKPFVLYDGSKQCVQCDFVNDLSCVACAATKFYIDVNINGFLFRKCIDICPSNFYIDFQQQHNSVPKCVKCDQSIPYGYLDQCFSHIHCTSNSYIIQDGKEFCVDNCLGYYISRNDIYTNLKQCVRSCPESHKYRRNYECSNIPCQYYIKLEETQLCQNSCTYYIIDHMQNKQCVLNCQSVGLYLFNYQCIPDCTQTIKKMISEDNITCIVSCTGEYANTIDGKCSLTCNFYIFTGNKYCVDNCPSEYPFLQEYSPQRKQCVDQCQFNWLKNGTMECLASCPFDTAGYITQFVGAIQVRICLPGCPAKYQDPLTPGVYQCLSICPNFVDENDFCIDECPLGYGIALDGVHCSQYCWFNSVSRVNGKEYRYCVESKQCPDDYPFLLIGNTGRGQCVSYCQFVSVNNTCLSSCEGGSKGFQRNIINSFAINVCFDSCPQNASFLAPYPQTQAKQCVMNCSKLHLFLNSFRTECVQECQPGETICKGKCVLSCSSCYPHLYSENGVCSDKCQNYKNPYTFKCEDTCDVMNQDGYCVPYCQTGKIDHMGVCMTKECDLDSDGFCSEYRPLYQSIVKTQLTTKQKWLVVALIVTVSLSIILLLFFKAYNRKISVKSTSETFYANDLNEVWDQIVQGKDAALKPAVPFGLPVIGKDKNGK